MKEIINKIKDIILENNYFNTLAGERYMQSNDINDIIAVISFSGRSKKHECYNLKTNDTELDLFVTHLMIDRFGNVIAQLGNEDTDDINAIKGRERVDIRFFNKLILTEWIELLTW